MQIVDRYSFAGAEELLHTKWATELREVEDAILLIDGRSCYVKASKELGKGIVFSPIAFNHTLLHRQLYIKGWSDTGLKLTITKSFPRTGKERRITFSIDGLKNSVGLESQLGKYSFLEYDTLAKMPIYQAEGLIQVGIEIVPTFRLSRDMSSGVGDFERIATILDHRRPREGDFPVLVLGIDLDPSDAVPRPDAIVFDTTIPVALKGSPPGPKRPA